MNSKEVQGIIGFLLQSGVPANVTATWDDPALKIHVPNSYHYREGTGAPGLAVDFGSTPPGDTAKLRRIYNVFVPVRDRLAELLGPGDPGHDDHVHVAVNKGTFLVPFPSEVPMVPVPPPDKELLTAFAFQAGYVLVAKDGAIYCFGCDYKGGLQWNGTGWVVR